MEIKDNGNTTIEKNDENEIFENININEEIKGLNQNLTSMNEQSTNNNIKEDSNKNDEKITENNKIKKESLLNKELKIREKANKEYDEIIKNDPAQLFSIINEETIKTWENTLYKKVENLIKEDCNILNSENSQENYKVVSNDIPRTRFKEKVLVNQFTSLLEYFIGYYCMENKIVYKQGLNEIVAPFLLLKYKLPDIPFYKIYNLFSGFINTFATNYFYEKTFFSLKNSLGLLTLLLKYHAPIVQNLFDKIMISPEMYATNWILTTFCGKLKLHLIYHLMNKVILEEDPLIFHFLTIALLINKKNLFFESDLSMIPVAITTISIDSIQEVDTIFDEALKLRENTPYSFRMLANSLEIFKLHCEDPKSIYEKYRPDKFLTLPIFPSEIFYICFNGETKCPDKNCRNNTKNKNKNEDENITNLNLKKCEYCDMNIKKDLNYIVLDLRLLEFEGQEEKTAFLPKVIKIEQKTLKSKYFTDSMIQRFNDDKGKSHLIFMTSKTDFFNEFEENFYIDSSPEENYYKLPLKTDKEINKDLVNKMPSKDKFKLKEYDNMKKLLIALLENDFPYISFIYGGFEAVHEEVSHYNADIYLLNHDKNCEICKLKQQNNSWFSEQITSFIRKSKTFINNIELLKKENNNNSYIQRISSINNKKKRLSERVNNTKFYNMEDISQLINNYENFVKYCSLVKYQKTEYDENDNQGILVIQKYYLLILKMKDNDAEQIDKIILNFVEKAEIKKKNHIIIDFIDNEKKKFSLEAKFGLEQDAKKFVTEINKAIKSKEY